MSSRRFRLRSTLAAILAVLVLAPATVLFVRVWQNNSGQRTATALERKGVEYLSALAPLINSLVEYQSSAVQGVAAAPQSLKPAIAKVADVDGRLGDTLHTRDRWAGLQEKIAKLPKATGGQLAVFQAHSEVLDLTVALYDVVRRNSELNRDPDNDIANLQEAVAVDMPTAVQVTNAMGALANITTSTPAAGRPAVAVLFGESVLQTQREVNDLTSSLRAAVDDTHSPTLSGSLVTTLDEFRRGIEAMTRGANLGGSPNIATVAIAQSTLQTALTALAGVTLREMGKLLDTRMSTLNYRRAEAALLALVTLALVAGLLILWFVGRRPADPATPVASPAAETARPDGYTPAAPTYDQVPAFGEADPTRRERFGALR